MTIKILSGLSGSGKTTYLINEVNNARLSGRSAYTFLSKDLALYDSEVLADFKIFSRTPQSQCSLDFLVTTDNAIVILNSIKPGSFIAFDEFQYFGKEINQVVIDTSKRNIDILISTPSAKQLDFFKEHGAEILILPVRCQRNNDDLAVEVFHYADENRTEAVCAKCAQEIRKNLTLEIERLLERNEPNSGKKCIYQPVLSFKSPEWMVIRDDSDKRLEIMSNVLKEIGVIGNEMNAKTNLTYLDVGCNTGFFPRTLSKLGFWSTGIDIVESDIKIAKLLDIFFSKTGCHFIQKDAYEFLIENKKSYTVTSSFSVLQWVMIAQSVENGLRCLTELFNATKSVCFLELGYTDEAHYQDKIPFKIDQNWVLDFMKEHGHFSKIILFEKEKNNIKRDFFVGIK